MAEPTRILVDEPSAGVRRITLNRPEKRNAIDNAMRGELLQIEHLSPAIPQRAEQPAFS